MPKNLLLRALDSVEEDPADYVIHNYEKLKKEYGPSKVIAVQGLLKAEGGGRIVGSSDSVNILLKVVRPTNIFEGMIILGTVEDIFKGKGEYVEQKSLPIPNIPEELRRSCS